MNLREKLSVSLQSRFMLAILLSVCTFVVVVLVMAGAFVQVRSEIHRQLSTQLQQSSASSQLGRDLLQFSTRLQLLEIYYYGDDSYLQQEGVQLQRMLRRLHSLNLDSKLQAPLTELEGQLDGYLQGCRQINRQLLQLRPAEQRLRQQILQLDEQFRAFREHRGHELIDTVHDDLLNFFSLNKRQPLGRYRVSGEAERPPGTDQFHQLLQQLNSLLTAEPRLAAAGQMLRDGLTSYWQLTDRFWQQLRQLGDQSRAIGLLRDTLLLQLDELTLEEQERGQQTAAEVDATILATASVVLGLLLLLAALLVLIQTNLFVRHIRRPLLKLQQRLIDFQQGDQHSTLVLQRRDEWGRVETVFNQMLQSLNEGWSALQQSEKRYREIFDTIAVGYFQSQLDGKMVRGNPALLKMLGLSSVDELMQVADSRQLYVDPRERQRLIDKIEQQERVEQYEVQLRRASGEPFWALVNCHLNRECEPPLLEGSLADIDYRRQAEEELRRLQEYLDAIIDTMPSVLIGVDAQLRVTLWNQQIAELTGVPASQARGQVLSEVFSLLRADDYLADLRETLQEGTVHRVSKVTAAGGQRSFDLLIYPLSPAEQPGAVIHMDDMTDQVKMEEVMVQSEKMLSVGSLAAGIAHEINNPLASVLQNVQVMEQRLSPALKKNRQVAEEIGIEIEQVNQYAKERGFEQMIRSIADAGQRAARIIENMLNFSRRGNSGFLPHSLQDLVEKTVELAASDYDMKKYFDFRTIKLVREFEPLPDVMCEPSQIQQVLLSLLKNAAEELSQQEDKKIVLRLFQRGEQACLQVEDNGAGMDEDTRRRIFEPFYTTKAVGEGTGLGLSVAYFLIKENHKGDLTIDSKPGAGACFTIRLPLQRGDAAG